MKHLDAAALRELGELVGKEVESLAPIADRGDTARDECTRDPIFLFQRRRIFWHQEPSGWECSECFEYLSPAEGEDLDALKARCPDAHWPSPDDEFEDTPHMCWTTAEQYGCEGENYRIVWDTEMVFWSREEGEAYGKRRDYNYRDGWRVYCVCANDTLAALLKEARALVALRNAAPSLLSMAGKWLEARDVLDDWRKEDYRIDNAVSLERRTAALLKDSEEGE